MNPKVINPYSAIGSDHKATLDYLIANLQPNPTFNDLNTLLSTDTYPPDPNNPNFSDFVEKAVQTILPHAYNGYVNSHQLSVVGYQSAANERADAYWSYNEAQLLLIRKILSGISAVPAESIGQFLSDCEEEVVAGRLTYAEQMPLLIAVAIGKSNHEYWMAQIAAPTGWVVYLNADPAINYAHLAGWVSSAMQGALLAYGLIRHPQIQLLDTLTSSVAAAGIGAGKVIFKWLGR